MNKPRRPNINCRWLTSEEAEKQGYFPHFGYCLPSEYHMLTRKGGVIDDLERAKRPYVAVEGNARGVIIHAK